MDDATLILIILVVQGAGLQAVWVLRIQQLRTQKRLIHLLRIICRLRLVLLVLILLQLEQLLAVLILLMAIALLVCRMCAVKLLLGEKELLGLEVQSGVSAVALGNEPVVLDAARHRGHHHWQHLYVTTAESRV